MPCHLPTELLAEIFELAVQPDPVDRRVRDLAESRLVKPPFDGLQLTDRDQRAHARRSQGSAPARINSSS